MIGGVDIELRSMAGDLAVEVAVRAVRQHWPHAVFENPETAERYETFLEIPFGELNELFIYRDAAAADAWDAQGAVPELYNTMVHIVADPDTVTVVVDEKNSVIDELVGDISQALKDEILYVRADFNSWSADAA
jgi:hypothetical protein